MSYPGSTASSAARNKTTRNKKGKNERGLSEGETQASASSSGVAKPKSPSEELLCDISPAAALSFDFGLGFVILNVCKKE